MPIELDTTLFDGAKIKVIGVGGGGGNAINNMVEGGVAGVEFIAANTDEQALEFNLAKTKITLGLNSNKGLGAGGKPEVGATSVSETEEELREALKNSDMVFVTAGMGGGTGTGGAPEVARIAQELNALVVGIVTKPFDWEGKKRIRTAEEGIKHLREHVDALIVIQNQRLLEIIDKNTTFKEAFKKVDEVLYNATRGISDIINRHGRVNVDFADVKTIMKGMGDALMGIGIAKGENRAKEATMNALNSPLLDGISIAGSQGVLVNISGGEDLTMMEVSEAVSIIENAAGEDANIIHGVVVDESSEGEIMITVVATGFNNVKPDAIKEATQAKSPASLPFPTEKLKRSKEVKFDTPYPGPLDFMDRRSSPRGLEELRKYDSPAYERRGVNIPAINSDLVSNGKAKEKQEIKR
jgi:cell division protein FtsZ